MFILDLLPEQRRPSVRSVCAPRRVHASTPTPEHWRPASLQPMRMNTFSRAKWNLPSMNTGPWRFPKAIPWSGNGLRQQATSPFKFTSKPKQERSCTTTSTTRPMVSVNSTGQTLAHLTGRQPPTADSLLVLRPIQPRHCGPHTS